MGLNNFLAEALGIRLNELVLTKFCLILTSVWPGLKAFWLTLIRLVMSSSSRCRIL